MNETILLPAMSIAWCVGAVFFGLWVARRAIRHGHPEWESWVLLGGTTGVVYLLTVLILMRLRGLI